MRRYQVFLLAASLLSLLYIVMFTVVVSVKAAQGGDLRQFQAAETATAIPETVMAPQPGESMEFLATEVFIQAGLAADAAADAQRSAGLRRC